VPRALKPCSTHGCGEVIPQGTSRCADCDRKADRLRGSRGYQTAGHRRFRRRVLDRDPLCVVCCEAVSTVADHYPMSRRELEAAGLDPNDPARGRGVCARCHNRETARHQPGGWAAGGG
jgi:5-methylcytosine-specific restriction protein A